MISLLPLGQIITYIAVLYSIFPILIIYFTWRAGDEVTIYYSIKLASIGAGGLSLILYLFFAYGWRIVWRLVPLLNTTVFPDLNGKWDMKIEWNRQGRSGVAQATATIKQSFLKFSMEVHSKDSDSETLLAQPKKDAESGTPLLYYVYRVIPKQTGGKRDSPYDGAAVLKISQPDELSLQGNYFTSAETRGHFWLTRPVAVAGVQPTPRMG